MSDGFVNSLVTRLESELEEEFPGWLITRESSGRWTATRTDWGSLYGKTAADLRARMRRHIGEAAGA